MTGSVGERQGGGVAARDGRKCRARRNAVRLAHQALDVGPNNPDTLYWVANILFLFAGQEAVAMAEVDRALALNSNSARVWQIISKGGFMHPATSRSRRSTRFTAPCVSARWTHSYQFLQCHGYGNRSPRSAKLRRGADVRCDVGQMLALDPGLTISRYRERSAYYMARLNFLSFTQEAWVSPVCRKREFDHGGSTFLVHHRS